MYLNLTLVPDWCSDGGEGGGEGGEEGRGSGLWETYSRRFSR